MPTIHDVARLAGLSTATVSHVINDSKRVRPQTAERVRRAVAQLNFVPNATGRLLALKRTPPAAVIESKAERTIAGTTRAIASHGSSPATVAPSSARQPSTNTSHETPHETARAMLRIVRAAEPISRADLARRLEISRGQVTEMVKPLLASGLLREAGPEPVRARVGRPPIGLSFREEHTFFIGVNIGVRRSQVGAALVNGRSLAEESFDTPSDPNVALAQIRASVERLCVSLPERTLSAIGVSVPGPTDARRTRLLFAPHLGWRDVAVAEALRTIGSAPARTTPQTHYQVPVIVENDAAAAAIYERRRRLRNCRDGELSDFVLVRAGTGIGVGLVMGGEVYRGAGAGSGLPGEFGHMTIVAGGKPCACGNQGCWERYASAASVAALYAGERLQARKGKNGMALRFTDIVARAAAGELRAQATLARTGDYLGIGISNIISGLGIPRIVVSGRVVYGWKFIEKSLRAAVARSMVGRLASWSIEPGEPTGAGLGGALEVVIEQHLAAVAAQCRPAA